MVLSPETVSVIETCFQLSHFKSFWAYFTKARYGRVMNLEKVPLSKFRAVRKVNPHPPPSLHTHSKLYVNLESSECDNDKNISKRY